MKKVLALLLVVAMIGVIVGGCAKKEEAQTPAETQTEITQESETVATKDDGDAEANADDAAGDEEITIVYTNDIHSYVYNTVTDKDNNVTPAFRLSNVAAMVNDMRADGKNVILVDDGDQVQGSAYGAYDNGKSIIDIMNAAGYQVSSVGNHDFDYDMNTFNALCEQSDFPHIACNFRSIPADELILPATYIIEAGGKKIAFVGICTPDTINSSRPKFFQDEDGNPIYSFDGSANPEDLYKSVQAAVDNVRDEADYVIALGHTGVGLKETSMKIDSLSVIENTTGIDAYIDGHSHTTLIGEKVANKDGKEITITQTGAYLAACGVMTIGTDGTISTELISGYDGVDSKVAELEEKLNTALMDTLGAKVAELNTTLYVNNPEDDNQRLIRAKEMNNGDFVADAIYWYFNDFMDQECDIAIQNGGGVRAQIKSGDISALDLKNICPFENQVCMSKVKGQDILDCLEMGASMIGIWDDEWNAPAENGGFMHVAGLQYKIDSDLKSSVKCDDAGNFVSVDGDYKVSDVKVYNRETGEYEPLDLNGTYTVAGINYLLKDCGNGLSMFKNSELIIDFAGQDSQTLVEYSKAFKKEGEYPVIKTENSPLAELPNYMINYENPYGAGRIVEK